MEKPDSPSWRREQYDEGPDQPAWGDQEDRDRTDGRPLGYLALFEGGHISLVPVASVPELREGWRQPLTSKRPLSDRPDRRPTWRSSGACTDPPITDPDARRRYPEPFAQDPQIGFAKAGLNRRLEQKGH